MSTQKGAVKGARITLLKGLESPLVSMSTQKGAFKGVRITLTTPEMDLPEVDAEKRCLPEV